MTLWLAIWDMIKGTAQTLIILLSISAAYDFIKKRFNHAKEKTKKR